MIEHEKTLIVLGLLSPMFAAATASATPQPLPFTYVYETLPKGSLELEQYADYTPIKVVGSGLGHSFTYGASQFQTEFEYGITDRPRAGALRHDRADERRPLRTFRRSPKATESRSGCGCASPKRASGRSTSGLYGELVENERELELEAKIILQRRIGDLRIVANLWGEREYEDFSVHQGDWVLNPTLGVTYQVTPAFHPGVEGWMRTEYPDSKPHRARSISVRRRTSGPR